LELEFKDGREKVWESATKIGEESGKARVIRLVWENLCFFTQLLMCLLYLLVGN